MLPKDSQGLSTGNHYEKMGMHGREVADATPHNRMQEPAAQRGRFS